MLAAPHLAGGHAWPIAEVLLVAVGYAAAPLIAARKLADVPALPMTTACLILAALVYTPAAILTWPHHLPSGQVLAALAALGVICTAAAFLVFLRLIGKSGRPGPWSSPMSTPRWRWPVGCWCWASRSRSPSPPSFVLILAGCVLATASRGPSAPGGGFRGRDDRSRGGRPEPPAVIPAAEPGRHTGG